MKINYKVNEDNVVVALSGEMDTPSALEIQKDIDEVLRNASKQITIDCAGLTYIASCGLRLFISIHKRCKSEGGHMTLKNVCPDVLEILSVTNFDKVFDICH